MFWGHIPRMPTVDQDDERYICSAKSLDSPLFLGRGWRTCFVHTFRQLYGRVAYNSTVPVPRIRGRTFLLETVQFLGIQLNSVPTDSNKCLPK